MQKTEKKEKKEKKHSFRDFKAELKKVIWPTPKQLINNTVAVITIVLITAVIVFVLDLAFENSNKFIVNKLQQVVESKENEVTENDEEQEDENATSENNVEEEKDENKETEKEDVNE